MNALDLGRATQDRELQDDELEQVSGGIRIDPLGAWHDLVNFWKELGATGTLNAGLHH
jgi:bacteriocin-like protein